MATTNIHDPRVTAAPRRWLPDAVAVVAILALFPIVHNVPRILSTPYFLDEAWVALSTRLPLSDLPVVTASTPIGWSLLLRLVPDPDALRLVPLAFHLLTVVAGYALGRSLAWPNRVWSTLAGVVCGLAVLLVPVEQVRHDLKQYTADAAVTLGLLALSAWVEAGPTTASRRRLGVLVAFAAVGVLVSHAAVPVAPCVFAGLILVAALRRDRPRLVATLVACVAVGLVIAAVFLTVDRRANGDAMRAYWGPYFPTVAGLPHYLRERVPVLVSLLGLFWPLLLLLVGAGVVALARRGRAATAVAVVLLPVLMVLVGLAKMFPLLDVRTSHFLFVTFAAVAGLGLVGAVEAAARRLRRARLRFPVAATACAVLLGAFVLANLSWYRYDGAKFEPLPMNYEDTRTATRYVADHRGPNDVILVNQLGAYGFGYYWRDGPLALVTPYPNTLNWSVSFPGQPLIVVAAGPTPDEIADALNRALTLTDHSGGRVWLIRTHVAGHPSRVWQEALARYHVELVTGGREPVALVSR